MQHKNFFVVEEDTNLYNIFATDSFDPETGCLYGYEDEEGYNLADFEDDIVFTADDWEECDAWIDEQLGYEL